MHPDIEKLIVLAAKGDTVTPRQREIIRNKAVALGEDPDEVELVLDLTVKKNLKQKKESADENDIEVTAPYPHEVQDDGRGSAISDTKKTFGQILDIVSDAFSDRRSTDLTKSTTTENGPIKTLSNSVSENSKSKLAASLLALFFGGLGIHKFYLGNTKAGILYLLFSWTMIPLFIGWIDALVYFFESDNSFQKRIK